MTTYSFILALSEQELCSVGEAVKFYVTHEASTLVVQFDEADGFLASISTALTSVKGVVNGSN
jgi:hypothetical protein